VPGTSLDPELKHSSTDMSTRYAGLRILYKRPQTKKSMVICSRMLLVRIVKTVSAGGSGVIDTGVRLPLSWMFAT